MVKLPYYLKQFFWDTNFNNLDYKKHPIYIIERLLEFGDEKAVRWVWQTFSKKQIRETVCTSRVISKKTASFWSLISDIPEREIRCLQPDFQKTHRVIWPY